MEQARCPMSNLNVVCGTAPQAAPCWGTSFKSIQHFLCIYSVMSLLTCGLSPSLLAHYQGFSGELQSNEFPRVICGQECIPSFSEVLTEWGEKTPGKQVEIKEKKNETKTEKELENKRRKGTELPCSLRVYHSPQISTCSPTRRLSKPPPLGFLWRLHYYSGVVE